MKSKCTTIVKVVTALVLAVLMMVGSVANVVGAVIEQADFVSGIDSVISSAKKGAEIADLSDLADKADADEASVFDDENEIVRGMKQELADTGAKADLADTGWSGAGYVKGTWDNWATPDNDKGHSMAGDGYKVTLAANTTYEFCFVAGDNSDVFKKDMTVTGNISNYDFNKDATKNAKIKTTIAGEYTFHHSGYTSSSIRVNITYPVEDPPTWSVAGGTAGNTTGGQTDPLFGSTWDATLTQNDMTNTSGTTWTWSKNNVELTAGKILCKVVKNHSYETCYPTSSNQESSDLAAGLYNVTITFDSSTHAITITATAITRSTLTVDTVANAVVTASYKGTTAAEEGTISNVPEGATVTVSVTPDKGYKCTGITSTRGGATSGALYSFTLTMPAAATTVGATITTVSLKKVYFSNSVTGYGQVYAYVHKVESGSVTDEYLGKYPGTTMTKCNNSNIWYIEVPDDETYIEFISGEGYATGELAIPWYNSSNPTTTFENPKYYPGMDRTNPKTGGNWYGYTSRTNEYTVTDGSTMSASNLFTGITATLYDYYVDDETGGNWLTGLNDHTANYNNTGKTYNDPYYSHLNTALMQYANTTDMPEYGVTKPLYFGNLNYNGNATEEAKYYNWNGKANNSNYLSNNKNAATGLSGQTLLNSTIHYYKAAGEGVVAENGAPMAMFDEDFLSGENKAGERLATILHTSSFPVRKENSVKSLCLDMSSHQGNWEDGNTYIAPNFHNGNTTSGNLRVLMTPIDDHKYTVTVPSGYTEVEWLKYTSADISGNSTYYKNAGAFSTNNTYTFSSGSENSVSGSWTTNNTLATGHTYYEYDSTGGKDNAFITDIDTTNKTAKINYYAGSSNAVKSYESNKEGFFPFDYNNIVSTVTTYPNDTIYIDRTGYYTSIDGGVITIIGMPIYGITVTRQRILG